jgi:cell division protein FtsQ
VAKTGPTDYRVAALADDDDLEDFYRPEVPARPRASSRAPNSASRQVSAQRDFADTPSRSRARETQYAENDPYDDPDFLADEEDRVLLRSRRRVPIRRNPLLSTRWGRIGLALCVLAVLGILTTVFLLVRNFFLEDPRFRIDSASSIQILGNSEISRTELLSIFGSDVGHNVFRVPLAQRRTALQQLAWVEHATVMRLLPNEIRVSIVERVPAAFVRIGNKIELVDGSGVLLTMPPAMLAKRHYSFPVVIGINPDDPADTRAERMRLYQRFVGELDSTGAAPGNLARPSISQQLSEVDVSDPEDVRAIMPSAGTDILVHFGDDDFATRYKAYQQHLQQWRQQYPHLAAIDLRYDRQTVLEMDKSAGSNPADAVNSTPALTPANVVARKPRKPAKPPARHAAKPSPKPFKKASLQAGKGRT